MRMLIAVLFTVLFQIAMLAYSLFSAYDAEEKKEGVDVEDKFGFIPFTSF